MVVAGDGGGAGAGAGAGAGGGSGGRNAEEALYCPPSNYARIIKVESHREYWRAVHSNCSLGIYTCGTPWIAPGPFRISPTPFLPASVPLSLFLFYFYACPMPPTTTTVSC